MNRLATASVMLGLGGLLFSACGGASGQSDQSFLACPPNTFRLVGSVDQMSVDISEPTAGGFSQGDDGGAFDQGELDLSTGTRMELDWKKGLLDGETGAATGTFQLPSGAPFAGQTFRAGAGTEVHMPVDTSIADIQFVLDGLTSADGPRTPAR
ncbi:MAG TPA: hypothetical protein VLT58_04785 [Polyangia bacterium]|nr:hypothetical protein [Polyangia bacterium]